MRLKLPKQHSDKLLLVLDLAGIFVFAVEGASSAIAGRLDVLGIFVLAFVTALGGGLIRDVMIGAIPPKAIDDWRYTASAFAGAAVVCFLQPFIAKIPESFVLVLDTAGLSLFAVAGAQKALHRGIHPFLAVLMGAITGAGGGTMRDVLLSQVPTVLHSDIYAAACLAGAAVMIIGRKSGLSPLWASVAGGVACFALRLTSVALGWSLPKIVGA